MHGQNHIKSFVTITVMGPVCGRIIVRQYI